MKVLNRKKIAQLGIYSVCFFITVPVYSQLKHDLRLGYPININRSINNHLKDVYSLKLKAATAFNYGFNYGFKNGYYFSAECHIGNYFYNQNSIALKLNQLNSTFGLGKKNIVKDKFTTAVQLDIGACLSSQQWYSSESRISYLQSWNESNYSIVTTDTRLKFYLGSDFYFGYRIGKSMNFVVGFKNSLIPMKKLDRVDDQSIYGFYFCPYIGIRDIYFNLKFKDRSGIL